VGSSTASPGGSFPCLHSTAADGGEKAHGSNYLQLVLKLFLKHHLALQRHLQLALPAHLRRMRVVPPAGVEHSRFFSRCQGYASRRLTKHGGAQDNNWSMQ